MARPLAVISLWRGLNLKMIIYEFSIGLKIAEILESFGKNEGIEILRDFWRGLRE